MLRTTYARRRGATAVVAAVSLIPIIGVTAMIIDGGLLMVERRRTQAAADAASFAAVCTYDKVAKGGSGRDPWTAASNAAVSYASANGYSNDGAHSTVTMAQLTVPPTRYGTADLTLQVSVFSHQSRLFSSILGSGTVNVAARSTSVRVSNSPPSIIVLSPSASPSLTVAGGAYVTAAGEVQVKSNATKAVDLNNMGHIKASTFKIAGNYQLSSSGYIDSGTAVKTGSDPSAMVDPLSTLTAPDPSGMTTRTSPSGWNATNPYPVYPGVYNSGLILNSGGMNYTMSPGVYYIKSGNFEVSNGVRATGTGVTIYLYNGDVNIQGGNGTSLTAPTSGTYQDVAIWQRSVYNSSTNDYSPTHSIAMANGTNNTITGKIYAPGASMSIAGGSNNTYGTQLIVNKLNVSNNAVVNVPVSTGSTTAAFHLAQ
ncbi:pilus assembly protein TadG-related protein [Paludisphaera rhizosphaerae]|uniref:pilus assembly protein TadG-related protein n=1 Tax=Paludisphaera rhizosphaerae TaxID=2711216 RepID=UPI0013ECB66F|nr:pilus assembly protein TadG-related protein [Paludisphaera rhizosphaerae]